MFYGYIYLQDFMKSCDCSSDHKEMMKTMCFVFTFNFRLHNINLFEYFLGIIEEGILKNSIIWIIDRHAGADEKVKLEEEVKFKDVSNRFNESP